MANWSVSGFVENGRLVEGGKLALFIIIIHQCLLDFKEKKLA